jgi:hypothetical protein
MPEVCEEIYGQMAKKPGRIALLSLRHTDKARYSLVNAQTRQLKKSFMHIKNTFQRRNLDLICACFLTRLAVQYIA